ncbi:uncharacterized protein LOC129894631 [Solanum dulcamara]|uniref:uncharacterized protein LOC129894631 n=1 Tax=Solanum dulcamara TaxID=45834 RepID=UPI002485F281|nr:uncharacterized protein LOC129894631 [Solanum dulcamara]
MSYFELKSYIKDLGYTTECDFFIKWDGLLASLELEYVPNVSDNLLGEESLNEAEDCNLNNQPPSFTSPSNPTMETSFDPETSNTTFEVPSYTVCSFLVASPSTVRSSPVASPSAVPVASPSVVPPSCSVSSPSVVPPPCSVPSPTVVPPPSIVPSPFTVPPPSIVPPLFTDPTYDELEDVSGSEEDTSEILRLKVMSIKSMSI